jgi:hypothetical protein
MVSAAATSTATLFYTEAAYTEVGTGTGKSVS